MQSLRRSIQQIYPRKFLSSICTLYTDVFTSTLTVSSSSNTANYIVNLVNSGVLTTFIARKFIENDTMVAKNKEPCTFAIVTELVTESGNVQENRCDFFYLTENAIFPERKLFALVMEETPRRRITVTSSLTLSINPSKPLMSSGSWVTLHNCGVFYLSVVNYHPATTDLIFITVNIYPGPKEWDL